MPPRWTARQCCLGFLCRRFVTPKRPWLPCRRLCKATCARVGKTSCAEGGAARHISSKFIPHHGNKVFSDCAPAAPRWKSALKSVKRKSFGNMPLSTPLCIRLISRCEAVKLNPCPRPCLGLAVAALPATTCPNQTSLVGCSYPPSGFLHLPNCVQWTSSLKLRPNEPTNDFFPSPLEAGLA